MPSMLNLFAAGHGARSLVDIFKSWVDYEKGQAAVLAESLKPYVAKALSPLAPAGPTADERLQRIGVDPAQVPALVKQTYGAMDDLAHGMSSPLNLGLMMAGGALPKAAHTIMGVGFGAPLAYEGIKATEEGNYPKAAIDLGMGVLGLAGPTIKAARGVSKIPAVERFVADETGFVDPELLGQGYFKAQTPTFESKLRSAADELPDILRAIPERVVPESRTPGRQIVNKKTGQTIDIPEKVIPEKKYEAQSAGAQLEATLKANVPADEWQASGLQELIDKSGDVINKNDVLAAIDRNMPQFKDVVFTNDKGVPEFGEWLRKTDPQLHDDWRAFGEDPHDLQIAAENTPMSEIRDYSIRLQRAYDQYHDLEISAEGPPGGTFASWFRNKYPRAAQLEDLLDSEETQYSIPQHEYEAARREFNSLERKAQQEYEQLQQQALIKGTPQYDTYVERGGRNQQELFVTMPMDRTRAVELNDRISALDQEILNINGTSANFTIDPETGEVHYIPEVGERYSRIRNEQVHLRDELYAINTGENTWQDGHGNYSRVENPIVRIRMNERPSPDGGQRLFVEEFQHPTKVNFEKMPEELQKRWLDIGVKRAVKYAVDNGFDDIAWTSGKQQARRWHEALEPVDRVEYDPMADRLRAWRKGDGTLITDASVMPEELDDYIGQAFADRIRGDLNKGLEDGLGVSGDKLREDLRAQYSIRESNADGQTLYELWREYEEPAGHSDQVLDRVSQTPVTSYYRKGIEQLLDMYVQQDYKDIFNEHAYFKDTLKYDDIADLVVGEGRGMHELYDKMVVNKMNAIGKKYGEKVVQTDMRPSQSSPYVILNTHTNEFEHFPTAEARDAALAKYERETRDSGNVEFRLARDLNKEPWVLVDTSTTNRSSGKPQIYTTFKTQEDAWDFMRNQARAAVHQPNVVRWQSLSDNYMPESKSYALTDYGTIEKVFETREQARKHLKKLENDMGKGFDPDTWEIVDLNQSPFWVMTEDGFTLGQTRTYRQAMQMVEEAADSNELDISDFKIRNVLDENTKYVPRTGHEPFYRMVWNPVDGVLRAMDSNGRIVFEDEGFESLDSLKDILDADSYKAARKEYNKLEAEIADQFDIDEGEDGKWYVTRDGDPQTHGLDDFDSAVAEREELVDAAREEAWSMSLSVDISRPGHVKVPMQTERVSTLKINDKMREDISKKGFPQFMIPMMIGAGAAAGAASRNKERR